MIVSVFVSSVWEGLRPERDAVRRALGDLRNVKFVGMEMMGAASDGPAARSVAEAGRCDVMVLILGPGYGSGITRREYVEACAANKPVLAYLRAEARGVAEPRQQAFIDEVYARPATVYTFSDPADLARRVVADVVDLVARDHHAGLTQFLLPTRLVGERVGADTLQPRPWLIDRIDAFMARSERGVFIIEWPAGVGKTSFAYQLAERRRYAHHFSELEPEGETALQALAAQLVMAYGDRLPARTVTHVRAGRGGRPAAFAELIGLAAEVAGEPIVLVVDGLDEASVVGDGNPLGLPRRLPAGVFVIATQRPGPYLECEGPREVCLFADVREANARDLRAYLTRAAERPRIAAALRGRDRATGFVDAIARASDGVWIYARYVLQEIEDGDRSPLDLATLPRGLDAYYRAYWRAWCRRHTDAWDAWQRRLLATLGAVSESLDASRLCALAGIDPTPAVERLLTQGWRAFIFATGRGSAQRFRIYHQSLTRFLHTGSDGRVREAAAASFEDEVTAAVRAAHTRIIDRYLRAWGGLPDLPALPDVPADVDRGYGLRHLPAHLGVLGRLDDIMALLSAERNGRNVWYTALDGADLTPHWHQHLRLARACEARTFETRAARQRNWLQFVLSPWPAGGRLARLALYESSTRTLATRVTPSLLAILCRSGHWSLARGRAYARDLANPRDRACALVSIAWINGRAAGADADDALTALDMIREVVAYADALGTFARRLGTDRLSERLEAAVEWGAECGPLESSLALGRLGPYLSPAQRLRMAAPTLAIEPDAFDHHLPPWLVHPLRWLPPERRAPLVELLFEYIRYRTGLGAPAIIVVNNLRKWLPVLDAQTQWAVVEQAGLAPHGAVRHPAIIWALRSEVLPVFWAALVRHPECAGQPWVTALCLRSTSDEVAAWSESLPEPARSRVEDADRLRWTTQPLRRIDPYAPIFTHSLDPHATALCTLQLPTLASRDLEDRVLEVAESTEAIGWAIETLALRANTSRAAARWLLERVQRIDDVDALARCRANWLEGLDPEVIRATLRRRSEGQDSVGHAMTWASALTALPDESSRDDQVEHNVVGALSALIDPAVAAHLLDAVSPPCRAALWQHAMAVLQEFDYDHLLIDFIIRARARLREGEATELLDHVVHRLDGEHLCVGVWALAAYLPEYRLEQAYHAVDASEGARGLGLIASAALLARVGAGEWSRRVRWLVDELEEHVGTWVWVTSRALLHARLDREQRQRLEDTLQMGFASHSAFAARTWGAVAATGFADPDTEVSLWSRALAAAHDSANIEREYVWLMPALLHVGWKTTGRVLHRHIDFLAQRPRHICLDCIGWLADLAQSVGVDPAEVRRGLDEVGRWWP